MAEHVQGVMAGTDLQTAGPGLVERIAAMPAAGGGGAPKKHISFAAKLAHFNLDPDRFPIYDSYAREMLRYHLGRKNWTWDWGQRYPHSFSRKNGSALATVLGSKRDRKSTRPRTPGIRGTVPGPTHSPFGLRIILISPVSGNRSGRSSPRRASSRS